MVPPAPLLTDGWRVVAVDLSGHGDSDRRDRYSLDTWAREVLGVVAEAGTTAPWDTIAQAQAAAREIYLQRAMVDGGPINSELFTYAKGLVRAAAERAKPSADRLQGYGDAQLNALIDEALNGSPTLAQAEARLRRARSLAAHDGDVGVVRDGEGDGGGGAWRHCRAGAADGDAVELQQGLVGGVVGQGQAPAVEGVGAEGLVDALVAHAHRRLEARGNVSPLFRRPARIEQRILRLAQRAAQKRHDRLAADDVGQRRRGSVLPDPVREVGRVRLQARADAVTVQVVDGIVPDVPAALRPAGRS